MLLICRSFQQVNFSELKELYRESNQKAGLQYYTDFSEYRQLLEAEQDFYQFLLDFFKLQGAFYSIWTEDHCYKSALRMEPYRDGLLLEGLETAPDSRHKGYAKRLLKETLNTLQFGKVYSHIEKGNQHSIQAHIACGFTKISDCAVYIDGSVDYQSFTYMKMCGA